MISMKCTGTVVRFNTFRDNKGQVVGRHGANYNVTGNYFLGDSVDHSIRMNGYDTVITNNYLENTGIRFNKGGDYSPTNYAYVYVAPTPLF